MSDDLGTTKPNRIAKQQPKAHRNVMSRPLGIAEWMRTPSKKKAKDAKARQALIEDKVRKSNTEYSPEMRQRCDCGHQRAAHAWLAYAAPGDPENACLECEQSGGRTKHTFAARGREVIPDSLPEEITTMKIKKSGYERCDDCKHALGNHGMRGCMECIADGRSGGRDHTFVHAPMAQDADTRSSTRVWQPPTGSQGSRGNRVSRHEILWNLRDKYHGTAADKTEKSKGNLYSMTSRKQRPNALSGGQQRWINHNMGGSFGGSSEITSNVGGKYTGYSNSTVGRMLKLRDNSTGIRGFVNKKVLGKDLPDVHIYKSAKSKCPRCAVGDHDRTKRGDGIRHAATTKAPSINTLMRWDENGSYRATDGCGGIEADGHCPHGHQSWGLRMGLV